MTTIELVAKLQIALIEHHDYSELQRLIGLTMTHLEKQEEKIERMGELLDNYLAELGLTREDV